MSAVNRLVGSRRTLDNSDAGASGGGPPIGGGPTGNGILLEDGTSFLLTEDGEFIIQED